MIKEKIKVLFARNKDLGYIDMFYYDQYGKLVSVCFEEGHSYTSLDYLVEDCEVLNMKELQCDLEAFKNLYFEYDLIVLENIEELEKSK